MIQYTFKYGPFYFCIHADNEQDAVRRARRSVEETAPETSNTYLKVELTAGAFEGRLYLEPGEITKKNIIKTEALPELAEGVPF